VTGLAAAVAHIHPAHVNTGLVLIVVGVIFMAAFWGGRPGGKGKRR
jgi:hypothetical protein